MGHYYGEDKGVLSHRILTEIDDDDDDDDGADHRDIDQVSNNDIIDAEPENDVEIGNDIKNVHDKVEYNNPAPMDISKHLGREMPSIDIGQQLMPGRTRGQTRDTLEIAEENFENFYMECAILSVIIGTIGNDEPRNFKEAWWYTDQTKRKKWREEIRKELSDMITRGVWKKVPLNDVPEGCRLIGSKWVFKEKRDGSFHAPLVWLGYSQVPGVDFSDNFAPVVNDVTFRIVQVIRLMFQLDAVLVDVETAFLYGVLNEEIYMKVPEGYKEVYGELNDTALLLIMAL